MKDVSAKEFIDAFAKHLKKGNRIKIPEVGVIVIYSLLKPKIQVSNYELKMWHIENNNNWL